MMSDDVQDWRAVLDGRREWAVVLGDNAAIRDDVPRSAAVVSDPPYGMQWDTASTRFSGGHRRSVARRGQGRGDWGSISGDDGPFDPAHWLDFANVVLFGCNHFAARLPVGTTLVWIKRIDAGFGSFLSDAELAWVKGGHGVYCRRDTSLMGETRDRLHPTQKPIGLMRWCLTRAKVPVDAVVFDPYCGSGTTGVACIQTGRRFIGVEIDPTYHAVAVDRLTKAAAARQLPLVLEV